MSLVVLTPELLGLIRLRGDWAYEEDGVLKPLWLLRLGPKGWEARQRKNVQASLRNRARLAQLRLGGYWFDEQRRLQAPVAVKTARSRPAAREPRRRNARTAARSAGARGDPSPSGSGADDDPHDVARPSGTLASAITRLWAHIRRREAQRRLAP